MTFDIFACEDDNHPINPTLLIEIMATPEEELKKLLEEIPLEKLVGGIECPKKFKCTRFSFEDLCKANDIGKEDCLECLEKTPCDCPFVIDVVYARLCRCPLRIYIAKNLKK